jgi:hypothetical protein
MEHKKSLLIPGQIYYAYLEAEPYTRLCNDLPDFLKALECLRRFSIETNQTRCRLLAYCLLPDSWHVIYIHDDQAMSALQDTFSQYRKMLQGHTELMTHRFSDPVLLNPDIYLAEAVRLLHWLPVRHKQVSQAEIYPWSSHYLYAGEQQLNWIDTQPALIRIANHRHKQQHRYQAFVQSESWLSLEILEQGTHSEYLAMAKPSVVDSLLHPEERSPQERKEDLNQMIEFICEHFRCTRQDLCGNLHHRFRANLQAALGSLATKLDLASIDEIAMDLDIDPQILQFNIRGYSHSHSQLLAELQEQYASRINDSANLTP